MGTADTDRTATICRRFVGGAEVEQLAQDFGVQRAAIYKQLRQGGALPPYQASDTKRAAARLRVKRATSVGARNGRTQPSQSAPLGAGKVVKGPDLPAAAPVRRDPCFRCGVRGDIGCAHQPLGSL